MRPAEFDPEQPTSDAQPATRDVARRRRSPTTPPYRRLRAFAFDPMLSTEIETAGVNQVTYQVAWEDDLRPGPVGEYLEVIDIDPAGACAYAPVDLNAPDLLATDGLAPSEGNPQFHQQMVYAVAMTTIRLFENALGRRAMWAPHRTGVHGQLDDKFVGRLRIYPHALREANAYYSPAKKALLFGYFPASAAESGRLLPGGIVFSCLSHDVIAHETTHALLDGLHGRFLEPSNPDVLAFHEAFSDVVALLQHFTHPEVLRQQIARTRGDLATENLLGQLAQQFGEAIGRRGSLRDALGGVDPQTGKWSPARPDPKAYEATTEPHARGSILVAAVFDAFLTIYRARIADLLRLATAGSGILPAGDLHPDLVNRLAREASKAARHTLTMCIRALDYCPPVDLTFGEFLRALITADAELVHDDDLDYRLAVVEAFRRRGLFPEGVRSLAPDSLVWDGPESLTRRAAGLEDFVQASDKALLDSLNRWDLSADRRRVFDSAQSVRRAVHGWLARARDAGDPTALEELTGLALTDEAPPDLRRDTDGRPKFEVHAVRPVRRVGPDGQLIQNLVVEVTQRRPQFLDPERQRRWDRGELPDDTERSFVFRGGSTLIFDLETARPIYFVKKSVRSEDRLLRQRSAFTSGGATSLRAVYFGNAPGGEPFALLHRDS